MTKIYLVKDMLDLTTSHRIVYRRRGAPESIESGLFINELDQLSTMSGDVIHWRGPDPMIHMDWLGGEFSNLLLERVIEPKLLPHTGMVLKDVANGMLWVYAPEIVTLQWLNISRTESAASQATVAQRYSNGELVIFTPEVP